MARAINDNLGDDCEGRIRIFDDISDKREEYIEFLRTLPDPYGFGGQVIERLANYDAEECSKYCCIESLSARLFCEEKNSGYCDTLGVVVCALTLSLIRQFCSRHL